MEAVASLELWRQCSIMGGSTAVGSAAVVVAAGSATAVGMAATTTPATAVLPPRANAVEMKTLVATALAGAQTTIN